MTNQEAIASLKTLCHTCELFPKCVNDKPECCQAIELAIPALEAQEAKTQLSREDTTFDLISRQAAIDVIDCSGLNLDDPEENWMMQDRIRELPSAQPEREKGKWIEHGVKEGHLIEKYTCSECDYYSGTKTSNFCPNCGADMRGDSDGSD